MILIAFAAFVLGVAFVWPEWGLLLIGFATLDYLFLSSFLIGPFVIGCDRWSLIGLTLITGAGVSKWKIRHYQIELQFSPVDGQDLMTMVWQKVNWIVVIIFICQLFARWHQIKKILNKLRRLP